MLRFLFALRVPPAWRGPLHVASLALMFLGLAGWCFVPSDPPLVVAVLGALLGVLAPQHPAEDVADDVADHGPNVGRSGRGGQLP